MENQGLCLAGFHTYSRCLGPLLCFYSCVFYVCSMLPKGVIIHGWMDG